jgi:hypothetical protein
MDATAVWKTETRTSLFKQRDRCGHADLRFFRQSSPPIAKLVCVFNFPFRGVNKTFMEYSIKGINLNNLTLHVNFYRNFCNVVATINFPLF